MKCLRLVKREVVRLSKKAKNRTYKKNSECFSERKKQKSLVPSNEIQLTVNFRNVKNALDKPFK